MEGGHVMSVGNGVARRVIALRDGQRPGAHVSRYGVHAARPGQHRLSAGIRAVSLRPESKPGEFHVTVEDVVNGAVADALGVPKLHVVETGGDHDQHEREQRDDGDDVVVLEPGVVVAYERNTLRSPRCAKTASR